MHNNFTETKGKGYPKSFWLMCVTIVWERFSMITKFNSSGALFYSSGYSGRDRSFQFKGSNSSLWNFGRNTSSYSTYRRIGFADSYLGQQKSVILGGDFL